MMRSDLLAVAWVLGASVLWTSLSVIVRFLDGRISYFDLSFYRAAFSVLLMAPLVWHHRVTTAANPGAAAPPGRTTYLQYGVRGALIFCSQALFYYALTHLDLASTTVLNATTAIFGTVFAVLWLGERVSAVRWLAILGGFAGIVVILRPGVAAVNLAALSALGSSVLFAWSAVLNKVLARSEPASRIVFFSNLVMVGIGIVPFAVLGDLPVAGDIGLLLLFCLGGATAQYCYSRALVHADASVVAPLEILRVPLAAFAGLLVFREFPDLWVWAGTAMIVLAVIVLARGRV
jgi:drug/metabolite transporter (DMT)-like permease